jgi:predicted phage terminase large subunit-like protein
MQAGGLIPRSHQWLGGTTAKWNEQKRSWAFPRGGTLAFGHMQYEKDMYDYQGGEYHFIGFDELTQFTERQYTYLFSRLRRLANSPVPARIRAASNPGGVGHEWVHQRFLVEGHTHCRPFIPARLQDNPHLDQQQYIASLMNLDPITRAQLLSGDWSARHEGGMFKREWFKIVDAAPASSYRVRYWDLAATAEKPGRDPDYTAGCLMASDMQGRYYVCDMRRLRASPQGVESIVRQTAELDGTSVPIHMEQEPGSSGVNTIDHYTRRVLAGFIFRGNRETGSKALRAAPLSSQAEAGNVYLVRGPWLTELLNELEAFPQGGHDDQVDAMSGAFRMLVGGGPVEVYAGENAGQPRDVKAALQQRRQATRDRMKSMRNHLKRR